MIQGLANGEPISMFHANIRSVVKNFNKLFFTLEQITHKFHIIGLTETWLKNEPDSILCLPGYNIEFVNRQNQKGGGVMIYIKDSLLYSLRHDLAIQSNYYESLFIEIQNENTKNIIIGLIYRPPGLNLASFTDDFSEILEKIASEKKTLLFTWRS